MPFNFKKLSIPGLLLIEPAIFKDERGFFMEKYKQGDFDEQNIPHFVQDNYSYSNAQGKLVSVIQGRVWDVAVDIRKGSDTFGKWAGVELSDKNNLSFYIPPGFAHGFATLSDEVRFFYKCTSEYNSSSEKGIRWNDPDLAIDWKIKDPQLCERDKKLPSLKDTDLFDH